MTKLEFVHPLASFESPSSHSSFPTILPSIFLGTQVSTADAEPPEQVQVESTERQSGAHPIPSVQFPSSHTSGPFHFVFPQTSQTLRGSVLSQLEFVSISQRLEHPSPFVGFPSSHYSGATRVPFPQVMMHGELTVGQVYPVEIVQFSVQPSVGVRLPSSHCSAPLRVPFPQV